MRAPIGKYCDGCAKQENELVNARFSCMVLVLGWSASVSSGCGTSNRAVASGPDVNATAQHAAAKSFEAEVQQRVQKFGLELYPEKIKGGKVAYWT
ncbi:MAG TPA: hypothetical protein VIV60_08605 [Polyangiaceae bacterium]